MTWILIIVLQGWGAGIGSTGNAVHSVEFSDEAAANARADEAIAALAQFKIDGGKAITFNKERADDAEIERGGVKRGMVGSAVSYPGNAFRPAVTSGALMT